MAKRRKGKGKATGEEHPAQPEQSSDTTTEVKTEANGSKAQTSAPRRSTFPSPTQRRKAQAHALAKPARLDQV